MNKLLSVTLIWCTVCCIFGVHAQTQMLSTYPTTVPTTSGAGVSFELTAQEKITINHFESAFENAGKTTVNIYYRHGGVQSTVGVKPVIDTANGWILAGSTIVNVSYAGAIEVFPMNLNLHLAPGVYGFFLDADMDLAYKSWSSGSTDVFSDGFVTLETGQNKGYGGAAPTPNSHPRQFVGSVIYTLIPDVSDNAAVLSVDSPAYFCSGSHNIIARIANLGNNLLNTVKVNWRFNGNLQPPVIVSHMLDTIGGSSDYEFQVLLGSKNFTADVNHNIEVWVSDPNGNADSQPTNDSIARIVRPAMSGDYFIDPSIIVLSNVNYKTFSDAIEALKKWGVCGPVVFNVKQGTYIEQLSIPDIPGSCALNNIAFKPSQDNSAPVILSDTGTADHNYVVRLYGGSHFNFDGLTFQSLGNYSTALRMEDGAHHNVIRNCTLTGPPTTSSSTDQAMIMIRGEEVDHNTIEDNLIQGGSYGVYYRGGSTSILVPGVNISGNRIEDPYYMGIYLRYTDTAMIYHNVISSNSTNDGGYGIYSYYGDNGHHIVSNVVKSPGVWPRYALRLNYADGKPASRGLVANNMFHAGESSQTSTINGMYIFDCEYLDVVHNNVAVEGASSGSRAAYFQRGVDVVVNNNNFLHYGNGYAIDADPAILYDFDYNNIASSGPFLASYDSNAVDLAAWQLMKVGMHSISVDSLFTDLDSLRTCDSSLYARGQWLASAALDIDGEQRAVAAPNIGADEYTYDADYFSLGDVKEFCNGNELRLEGNVKYGIFNWSTGSTDPYIIVTKSGVYWATVSSCAAMTDSVEVIDVYPSVDFEYENYPGEFAVGFTNLSKHANTHHWDFGDGLTSFDKVAWHRYASAGTYSVTLTVANHCDTLALTKEVVISEVGMEDQDGEKDVFVYPNPASEQIFVKYKNARPDIQGRLAIFDVKGQLHFQTNWNPGQDNTGTFRVSSLNEGVYFLKFTVDGHVTVKRIVIQR